MNMGIRSWSRRRRWTAICAVSIVLAAGAVVAIQVAPASAEVTFTAFVDQQTGHCLDSNYQNPDSVYAVGAVYTDPCNGGTYQEWAVTYIGNGTVTLTDVQTGYCLDSGYSSPSYPAVGSVYTDPCNGGRWQEWWAATNGSGNWFLQDAQTGQVLDSDYSSPADPSVGAVYTDGCNGGTYQQWTFPAGNQFPGLPRLPASQNAPAICPG
jgi:Ricin-type beta-trefoil lectin domain